MGILALYFCIVFGYEYTKIQAQGRKNFVKSCKRGFVVNDGILHVSTSLVFEGGVATLVTLISDDQKSLMVGKWRVV